MTAPTIHRVVPGEPGLWVFVFADLLLFGLMFTLAMVDRAGAPALFAAGQAELDPWLGMANTLVLLTGSWAVAMGTRVVTEPRRSAAFLQLAAGTGLIFLAFKAFEWSQHIAAGWAIGTDPFQSWYFALTGFHALHVIVAVALLQFVAARQRRGVATGPRLTEAAGCYWHLVDLLWVGIFVVLYLV